jgi:hypothetical protein
VVVVSAVAVVCVVVAAAAAVIFKWVGALGVVFSDMHEDRTAFGILSAVNIDLMNMNWFACFLSLSSSLPLCSWFLFLLRAGSTGPRHVERPQGG